MKERRPPLASGMVELIAATLDEELGKPKKGDKGGHQDLARRLAIEVLDHLEGKGLLLPPRRPPFGPFGPFGPGPWGPGGPGGPGRRGGPPPPDDEDGAPPPPPPPPPRHKKA
jgi:hypothetical protein